MAKSPRIIIDTNVFYSSIFYPRGNERKLFELADEGKLEIIIMDYVLDEIQEVLRRNHIDTGLVIDLLDTYQNIHFMELSETDYRKYESEACEKVRDIKDWPIFIFCLVHLTNDENAYLVSGDKDLQTEVVKKVLKNRVLRTKDIMKRFK
jgi:putative PIN family toxin of toxin-antitoxin system